MMTTLSFAARAASIISARAPEFTPKVGLVLGSGLGDVANQIKHPITISYAELPGFPMSTVVGHAGRLVLGYFNDMPVACLQGRAHAYEGVSLEAVQTLIRTLKLIGCDTFVATNVAGSLRAEVGPGSLMMITDHINFQGSNPLVGPNDLYFGPRFIAMTNAYDLALRERLLKTAKQLDIPLHQGTYIAVLGPSYETAAEIRMFRQWGADAVGMSTVPEVIIAHHTGMRVAVVSSIVNLAAGMIDEIITHEDAVHFGKIAAQNLSKLLVGFIGNLKSEPC
ncbi:MAG: purine-nucleoside phosphorylase [Gammaproteobacteria bacterium]